MTAIDQAVQLLRAGRLVAFPTETVYGLGADATNASAIDKIYATKGRPDTNPLIIHVADIATAMRVAADWPESANQLAEKFWPGPLTLVLRKRTSNSPANGAEKPSDGPNHPQFIIHHSSFIPSLYVPDNATATLQTVALRIPSHPLALELLRAFGGALAAPSANRSTHLSPTTARHVLDEFADSEAAGGNVGMEPALVLDGGACEVGIESTVLDLTGAVPTILRPGRISPTQIQTILGVPVTLQKPHALAPAQPALSPGQQEIHYAPRTPAYRFSTAQRGLIHPEAADGRSNGIVVLSPLIGTKRYGPIIAMSNDSYEYAHDIYGILRDLDQMNLAAIYIEMPPDSHQWAAIRDRLTRATQPLPS